MLEVRELQSHIICTPQCRVLAFWRVYRSISFPRYRRIGRPCEPQTPLLASTKVNVGQLTSNDAEGRGRRPGLNSLRSTQACTTLVMGLIVWIDVATLYNVYIYATHSQEGAYRRGLIGPVAA